AGPGTAPTIQVLPQIPLYGSDPNVLITPFGLQTLGLSATPAGWVVQAAAPLTPAEIGAARRAAALVGLEIETRSAPKSDAPLREWSTACGMLLALGVLAMTVGLIRSETGRDMRTLAATGAGRRTRRSITGATAGALALLGAVLGTAGAYAALLVWHRSDLHSLTRVPWANLALLLLALPALAAGGGWLLAGRQPTAMSRQPLE